MSSSGQGGPRWARDIITVSLWSASAVNVFIYTYRAAVQMWKRPPLSAWTGNGPGSALPELKKNLNEAFNQNPEGKKPEGESTPEKIINEGLNPLPPLVPDRKALGPLNLLKKVVKLFE